MAAEVSLPVWLLCDPLRGRQVSPVLVRYPSVSVVAHGLEGVAAITKVLDPVGQEFQFARLDLGAVLLLAEIFNLRRDLVDTAVEALDLGVQRIDEAPEQALAFVDELRAVRCDGAGQDVDRFLDPGKRLFPVPDLAIVELIRARGRAEQALISAACSQAIAVCDDVSVLMKFCMSLSNAMLISSEAGRPVVMTLWVTRSQRSHDCRNACAGGVREWCGRRERSEPRSRIPPALAAQRRGIARYRRNGA